LKVTKFVNLDLQFFKNSGFSKFQRENKLLQLAYIMMLWNDSCHDK